jgi:hypothetical protein
MVQNSGLGDVAWMFKLKLEVVVWGQKGKVTGITAQIRGRTGEGLQLGSEVGRGGSYRVDWRIGGYSQQSLRSPA